MSKNILTAITTVVALTCVSTSFASDLNEENIRRYHLGQAPDTHPFKLEGFSAPEGSHIWTLGEQSSCVVPTIIDGRQVKQVTFKNVGALASASHYQELKTHYKSFFFNGSWDYYFSSGNELQDCKIDLWWAIEDQVTLTFKTCNHCLPSVIDPNNKDPRSLAISFGAVEVLLYPEESESPPLALITMPAPSPEYLQKMDCLRRLWEEERKKKTNVQKDLAENQMRAALIQQREEKVLDLIAKHRIAEAKAMEEQQRLEREELERLKQEAAEKRSTRRAYAH
jgi:hypothetical protein